jgi:hypothetical protein
MDVQLWGLRLGALPLALSAFLVPDLNGALIRGRSRVGESQSQADQSTGVGPFYLARYKKVLHLGQASATLGHGPLATLSMAAEDILLSIGLEKEGGAGGIGRGGGDDLNIGTHWGESHGFATCVDKFGAGPIVEKGQEDGVLAVFAAKTAPVTGELKFGVLSIWREIYGRRLRVPHGKLLQGIERKTFED